MLMVNKSTALGKGDKCNNGSGSGKGRTQFHCKCHSTDNYTNDDFCSFVKHTVICKGTEADKKECPMWGGGG
jgi:hypothetical protein